MVVNACATAATGTAEREAAVLLLETCGRSRGTVGADEAYDVSSFVTAVRDRGFTPHLAQKVQYTAVDGRTTGTAGYAVSQRTRKLVEQVFGRLKTVGLVRKLRHHSGERVDWILRFTAATYNLVRLRTLLAGTSCPGYTGRSRVNVAVGDRPAPERMITRREERWVHRS